MHTYFHFMFKSATGIVLLLMLISCSKGKNKFSSPQGYDLSRPEKFIMGDNLLEISGISFNKGNPDTVYAIQDEDGKVFTMSWGTKKAQQFKFAKKNDYEDIAVMNEHIYVLRSDGVIFSFPKNAGEKAAVLVKEWKNILPESEYEGMYADEATGRLYILCKKCKSDDNKKNVSGYIVDTRDSLSASYNFMIDITQVNASGKRMNAGFRPSAISKDPVTQQWFILSGSNKLLVIADSSWKIMETYRLDGNIFNQAEGIAFDKNGNLYISNEGEEDRNGNILLFKKSVSTQ